jgi:porphobilinogen deaminase
VFGTIERSMGTVMLRCRRKSLTFVQAARPQLEHSRDTKCLFAERELKEAAVCDCCYKIADEAERR